MGQFCDTHFAIDLAENHQISEPAKHIDNDYYHVGKFVNHKTLPLMHTQTTDILVDMGTKG
jgi:hypothetical protein